MADGRLDLVSSVEELEAYEPCGCERPSARVSTPVPGRTVDGRRTTKNLVFDLDGGMLVLDLVEGVIRFVEVLDRPGLGCAESKGDGPRR